LKRVAWMPQQIMQPNEVSVLTVLDGVSGKVLIPARCDLLGTPFHNLETVRLKNPGAGC